MIRYEESDSPFYKANKIYCNSLDTLFKANQVECQGFCNAFGYEINACIEKEPRRYFFTFFKNQKTRNGVIYLDRAKDEIGIKLKVTGLPKAIKFNYGKSWLKRFFSDNKIKNEVPSPFYLTLNFLAEGNFLSDFVKKAMDHTFLKFNIRNGILTCQLKAKDVDPFKIISDIDMMIHPFYI